MEYNSEKPLLKWVLKYKTLVILQAISSEKAISTLERKSKRKREFANCRFLCEIQRWKYGLKNKIWPFMKTKSFVLIGKRPIWVKEMIKKI